MNIEFKEHIGVFNDVYPPEFCKHLCEQFDLLETNGVGSNRLKSEGASNHIKNDYQINLNFTNHSPSVSSFNFIDQNGPCEVNPVRMFFDGLQNCYEQYSTKYSTLINQPIKATSMKMQKTYPGGGYHVFHHEQGSDEGAKRSLVYILYLNTLEEEGGETEFLHQKLRIKPKENLLLLWPAAYTHAHRGNPVLGDSNKYIVTGWFYND